MNYPFLYQRIDSIDPTEIMEDIKRLRNTHVVWEDWTLIPIKSEFTSNYIAKKFPHLKIFNSTIFISRGTSSNFHIDRFEYHHLLHRLLIPLSNDFHYEWIFDGQAHSFKPDAGDVLVFNNMVPHRFVSDATETKPREVIYLDLIDEKLLPFVETFQGNYSQENAILNQNYNRKR